MKYRNATYALVDSLVDLRTSGDYLTVRNLRIAELRNRLTVLEKPLERCIITPYRRNDVFAAIAETMWVLGGRNDLAYLEHYLPRAGNFSDDGTTWRAAYGPRLRNWDGVDQVANCVRILRAELETRRAVMSLFDPGSDYIDSRDIPCNNWIHWLVRGGRIHMNIAVRSNDVIWGFSGVNTFEWSVLHDLMALWLDVEVGEATFFASSYHLYDRHAERAVEIIEHFPGITCYDIGLSSPRPQVPLSELDVILSDWFALEERSRTRPDSIDDAVLSFPDPLFRLFLQAIRVYNGSRCGWSEEYTLEQLSMLPETDVAAAAYEYFLRRRRSERVTILQPVIARYWSEYEAATEGRRSSSWSSLQRAAIHLHAEKSGAYGSSWKRRGEQISIMANIARKVDRLEHALSGAQPARDESLIDTAVDLYVYCVKYQTYLADVDSDVRDLLFSGCGSHITEPFSDGTSGFDFLAVASPPVSDDELPGSLPEAIRHVVSGFADLHSCFSTSSPACTPRVRLERLQTLTRQSLRLLALLEREQPIAFARLVTAYAGRGNG
jgi:hypothetical protein